MNIVIYARYSSHSQTEQSIEGQLKECYAYAKKNFYTVVAEYIDRATTGTTDNRPQFLKMIEDSNKKFFNGVLVYQLDRFARNRYDSAVYKNRLKKNNIRVLSARENISDDASGVLMESVLEGMAEYYSVELSQKIKRGMEINASKFKSIGGNTIALGFKIDDDRNFQIDENNAPIVRKIFEMYAKGSTMADIIRYLNSNNLKTSLGNDFNKNSIRRILMNKRYIGTYTYKGEETANVIPKIVDNKLFYEVQEMILKRKKAPARARAKKEYLLTTKLFCGYCKDMMTGSGGTSETGKVHTYYSCKKSKIKLCDKKSVQKQYIEDLVVDKARSLLTKDNITKIANSVVEYAEKEKDTTNYKRIIKALKDNEKQKINLLVSLKLCDLDNVRKTIFEEINKMDLDHRDLEKNLKFEESQFVKVTVPQVKFFLTEIRKGNVNDDRYRKMLIDVLIDKVYLYDDQIIMTFNTQDKKYESKIPTIEHIESSFKGQLAPPK